MKNQKGFIMITVVLLSSVLFAGALTYMQLVTGEHRVLRASQNQLQAQAISEAGVEDASWEYNYNSSGFTSGNGWTASGTTRTKTANVTNGGTTLGSYTVTVSNVDTSTPTVLSVGSATVTGGSSSISTRAQLSPQSEYLNALTTNGNISLSGNAYTDSYNSTAGAYGGANRLTNGDVQTNGHNTGAIAMSGNANVRGDAGTGSSGTITMTGNASITGSQGSSVANTISANSVPGALTALASGGAYSISSNTTASLGTAGTTTNYRYTSMSTSGNAVLNINGNVNLYLTGASSFSNTGNARVNITSGSSLTIYVEGSVSVSGNGLVNNNGTTSPLTFQLYGTSTATSLSISGNGSTTGIIDMPSAHVAVSGNGDIYGAIVADTFSASGNGGFHYDENLSTNGPSSGYKLRWARRL